MSRVVVNKSLKKKFEAAIAIKSASTANRIYNTIVTFEKGEGYPYYSGAYIRSWEINQTGQGGSILQGKPGQYSPPQPKIVEPNFSSPYKSWHVANSYSYAYEIEYFGTKYSNYTPWKTLNNAVTTIVFGSKEFKQPDF